MSGVAPALLWKWNHICNNAGLCPSPADWLWETPEQAEPVNSLSQGSEMSIAKGSFLSAGAGTVHINPGLGVVVSYSGCEEAEEVGVQREETTCIPTLDFQKTPCTLTMLLLFCLSQLEWAPATHSLRKQRNLGFLSLVQPPCPRAQARPRGCAGGPSMRKLPSPHTAEVPSTPSQGNGATLELSSPLPA